MKVQFIETDGCFSIDLTAETMQEAAALVRFGMNRTDEIRHGSTIASREGEFSTAVVFGKNKRANNDVPKRR